MFTENQVRQFYVATSTSADVIAPVEVDSTHHATDLKAKSAGACQFVINPTKDEAYLMYKGPSDDGLQRSDLLKKCNVVEVRLTDAADMVHIKKRVELTLDSNVSATPIAGQDYMVNIEILNYVANGDDSTKVKFGVAKAKNATASDLYKALAINLAKNFSRESVPLVKFYIKTASDPVEVTAKDTATTLVSYTATGIIIEEVEQPWRRGAAKQEFVNFNVYPSTIYTGGLDQIWGVVTDVTASNTSNTIPNSKKVADMEYFFHKERGDVYGYAGFPNNIDTTYQVDPNNADGYSFIDIHFYFEGNSHNVGKSEKTLTIVGTKTLLKKLFGSPATTDPAAAATGLYAFLEGTNTKIVESASWS